MGIFSNTFGTAHNSRPIPYVVDIWTLDDGSALLIQFNGLMRDPVDLELSLDVYVNTILATTDGFELYEPASVLIAYLVTPVQYEDAITVDLELVKNIWGQEMVHMVDYPVRNTVSATTTTTTTI